MLWSTNGPSIYQKLQVALPTKAHKQRFNYNNANWEDMNHFLSQYDFTLALNSNDPEFIRLFLTIEPWICMFPRSLSKNQTNLGSSIQQSVTKLSASVPLNNNLQDISLREKGSE